MQHPPCVPAGPSPSRKGERIYEPISVEVDRAYGDGTYRLHTINFTGRLVQLIEEGYTTMRLYEWVDRGYVIYLVHVEEDKSGRLPRRTLYPFINTHFGRVSPTKGYTAEEVSLAYPEFANEVGGTPLQTCCIGRVPLQREACGKDDMYRRTE
jgi:hypothetical protein